MLLTDSWTWRCASAILARAASSSRLIWSSSSLARMPLRPALSWSTSTVCWATCSWSALTRFS